MAMDLLILFISNIFEENIIKSLINFCLGEKKRLEVKFSIRT